MNTPRYRNLINAGIYISIGFVLSYVSLLNQVQDYMSPNEGGGGAKNDGSSNLRGSEDDVKHHDKDDDDVPVGLCERLQGKSAPWLWATSKNDLLQASLLQHFDPNGYHKEWMTAMLQQLSTTDLQKGLLHPPSALDLHGVIKKIEARMLANNNNASSSSSASAPIVHVGVFGGSVTQGNGCYILPDELKPFFQDKTGETPPDDVRGLNCGWPTRLQQLCDYFLGKQVIAIHNLGTGGARSTISLPVLKNRFFVGNDNTDDEYDDLNKHGFDVIINGHAVNDNTFDTESHTQVVLGNFQEAIHVAEAFYRQARTTRLCDDADKNPPPLVLFLNEYLGNRNELIVGENLRHSAVQLVSEYYDFAYVSYSHVFARFVYRRSNETLFSPNWGTMQQPKLEVHFGMSGHVLISWVLAYSALQSAVDYCNHQHVLAEDKGHAWNLLEKNKETNSHVDARLIPDDSQDELLLIQNSLPPRLATAQWSTISETWQHDAVVYKRQVHDYCALGENITQKPCPFAFLSSSFGPLRTAADALNAYLAPFIIPNAAASNDATPEAAGWQAVNDKITLRVDHLPAPVRLVTIHYMKSYGPEWDASIAQFHLRVLDHRNADKEYAVRRLYETNFQLTGWHDQKTSIGYAHELDLMDGGSGSVNTKTPAQAGTSIELDIALVQGVKFKIMAIMMCVR
jgi:hypothetical protein